MDRQLKRGDVYFTSFETASNNGGSSIQANSRPVLLVGNWQSNKYSSVITVVPLTTKLKRLNIPTHIQLSVAGKKSLALCEQIITIPKESLKFYMCSLNKEDMKKINKALMVQLQLDNEELGA